MSHKKIIFFGTYSYHPRQKLLLEAVRRSGRHEAIECHFDIWGNVSDKTQVRGFWSILRILFRVTIAYPVLIFRYLTLPSHSAVVFMHMGLFDLLLLGPFVRLRRKPILWDIYISLYDTVVVDRKLLSPGHLLAKLLFLMEQFAVRRADHMFLDTRTHGEYFEGLYGLTKGRVKTVYVGVDDDFFSRLPKNRSPERATSPEARILFYGQFIPLHGIEVIVEAGHILQEEGFDFLLTIVGKGQLAESIDKRIKQEKLNKIERIQWIEYDHLLERILDSDICLGIFGGSGKASHVIPNKIFQILAAGTPFITADTPAIRELIDCSAADSNCLLVPPGSAKDLARGIREMTDRIATGKVKRKEVRYGVEFIQKDFLKILDQTTGFR